MPGPGRFRRRGGAFRRGGCRRALRWRGRRGRRACRIRCHRRRCGTRRPPGGCARAARDGGVGLVGALFEDHVVAAHHALLGVGQLRHAADVGARLVERVFVPLGFALHHAPAAPAARSARGLWRGACRPVFDGERRARPRPPSAPPPRSRAAPRTRRSRAPRGYRSPGARLRRRPPGRARAGPHRPRPASPPGARTGKTRRPRATVCTLLSISSRMARCTSSNSSDCAGPNMRSVHLRKPRSMVFSISENSLIAGSAPTSPPR